MKVLLPVTSSACPPLQKRLCSRTRCEPTALRSDITRMAGVFVRSDCDQFTAPACASAAHTVAPASSVSAGRNPFHASAQFRPPRRTFSILSQAREVFPETYLAEEQHKYLIPLCLYDIEYILFQTKSNYVNLS